MNNYIFSHVVFFQSDSQIGDFFFLYFPPRPRPVVIEALGLSVDMELQRLTSF